MRKEHDLLGEMLLDDNLYYGVQTKRALLLCNPSNEKLYLYPELIQALVEIKIAAATTHTNLKVLDSKISDAIIRASNEILNGKFKDQFPIDLISGGGGVSIHMNVNEVIANRANEIISGTKGYYHVHPNIHINMGQSTNDVLPSAMKIVAARKIKELIQVLKYVEKCISKIVKKNMNVVKISRTCIQDAVPITFGQYLSAFQEFINRQISKFTQLEADSLFIPLGATAVGTGIGTYKGYHVNVIKNLSKVTKLNIKANNNLFDGLQFADFYVELSASLKSLAFGLSKIGRDIRILSSGPRSGINEINIQPVQNGSSIMPGKVNPSLPELMNIVAYQIAGNDTSISMASEGGELELNVWEPIFIVNISQSFKLLIEAIPVFTDKCLQTLEVNKKICSKNAKDTLALAIIPSALFGYEVGNEVAKYAYENNVSIKEAVLAMNLMDEKVADEMLDPLMLTDVSKSSSLLTKITLTKEIKKS